MACLLEKMSYGVGRLTKSGADGGIDGIIDEDELGLSQIYVQAKGWQGTVSRPEIKNSSARSPQADQKGRIYHEKFSQEAQKYAGNALAACLFVIYFV